MNDNETLTAQLMTLVAMLPNGPEHPVKASKLAAQLNTNVRTVTAWIAFLINHWGVPIGSQRYEPAGYYLITTRDDLERTIAPLTAQALQELQRAENLRAIDLDNWRDRYNQKRGVPNADTDNVIGD